MYLNYIIFFINILVFPVIAFSFTPNREFDLRACPIIIYPDIENLKHRKTIDLHKTNYPQSSSITLSSGEIYKPDDTGCFTFANSIGLSENLLVSGFLGSGQNVGMSLQYDFLIFENSKLSSGALIGGNAYEIRQLGAHISYSQNIGSDMSLGGFKLRIISYLTFQLMKVEREMEVHDFSISFVGKNQVIANEDLLNAIIGVKVPVNVFSPDKSFYITLFYGHTQVLSKSIKSSNYSSNYIHENENYMGTGLGFSL